MYKYSHGGNAVFEHGNEGIIDLSANINPLGVPEGVESAIIREFPNINRYPDNFNTLLCEKTAVFEGVKPEWIFFGNGASDIIFRLPRAMKAKKVMVCAPTFADYERSAQSYGAEICRHVMYRDDDFTLDGRFIKAVQKEKPTLIYVCNPNNPTGKLTEARLIGELLDCAKQIGAWVVVDECFMDFAQQAVLHTSKIYLEEYPNLVILKAFTKMFALPGIRLGYALCSDEALIDSLYFHGADWAVSNLAQGAGLAALDGAEDFIKRTVAFTSTQRNTLVKELARLGYKISTSEANYIFFRNPHPFDLREKLDRKGIRIRACGNYHGLDDSYYRIAVSTAENNSKLLAAMGDI
ncbi:MAG: aminotransferase class I/II-fold pyridoxal phosphate-dependent enzyme [Defluviitaleaceae bacterium]|nr:aminotransferase class I/II-fold pyridoxal phosphate-dependent enzyme [Defluviitaleaceae bacterium]MCL2238962.1 aminotransferase class I/II-fold pyridoxal phosphate-dependent enzyme [Defluviitaleaceae bacterium]